MRSVNKVIIIGNLTRDPEIRQTPNGQNVATFGVATNREWMTSTGDKKASAEFHECVAWAHLAEICQKYLQKGNLVYIEGYLKTRSWETPEGVKKFKTEIVTQDMIRLEKRKKEEDDAGYIPRTEAAEAPGAEESEEVGEDENDENDSKKNATEKKPDKKTSSNLIDQDLGL